MPTIKQIAEESWRLVTPNPTTDVANKLPEFELMAIGATAWICKLSYFNNNQEGGRIVEPCWLKSGKSVATQDEFGIWNICLPRSPLSLPGDVGLYSVKPNTGHAAPYVKCDAGLDDLIGDDTLSYLYVRIGNKITFPKGLMGGVKEILYLYVVMPDIDCVEEDLVPEDYRMQVIDEVVKRFNQNTNKKEDKTSDTKDNTRP